MNAPRASHPWVVLGLLTGFWGLIGLNRLGISYLFPILVPRFHLAYWQTSLLISGTSLTWAVSSWLSGWLSDHYGRRRVLLPGAFLACATTAAMGGAWNFLSMFAVREFVGLGDGVGWPNAQAVLNKEFPDRHRSLVHAVFTAGYSLFGTVLGAIIITRLAVSLGWRSVFPIIGGFFLLVVLGLHFFLREPGGPPAQPATRPRWRSAFTMLRSRHVVLLMLVQSGALGWQQVAIGYNSLYLSQLRHVGLVTIGSISAIFGVAALVGTVVLPYCSDFVGRKPALFISGLLSTGCLLLYALGGFNLGLSTFLLAASGFFWGIIIPLAAATCVVETVPEEAHATAMGAINFAGVMVGTFAMPLVAGVLADHFGLTSTMLLAAGCVAVAALGVAGIRETAPRVLARREQRQAAVAAGTIVH